MSPVLKTPEEVLAGSLLFLDMTQDGRILFDSDRFLRSYLDGLAARLSKAGAQRKHWRGGWYWDLGREAAGVLRGSR